VSENRESTLDANKYVHSSLVESGEYQRSPHFRPENVRKVRGWLDGIASGIPDLRASKAIDFGCGTGFMTDIVRDLAGEVHGVDATPAMLQRVDTSSGNVFVHECLAEETPFPQGSFALATAYSFMDHLHNVQDFLCEVYRVLRPGGIFFSGLNPNRTFILAMEGLAQRPDSAQHPVYGREIAGALHNGRYYTEMFGLDGDRVERAEPGKTVRKGFDPSEFFELSRSVGFVSCEVTHDWFLGQGLVMHQQPPQDVVAIEGYLRSLLPSSASLFKYLSFTLTK
jgi:SAM-dependent methyltransferase